MKKLFHLLTLILYFAVSTGVVEARDICADRMSQACHMPTKAHDASTSCASLQMLDCCNLSQQSSQTDNAQKPNLKKQNKLQPISAVFNEDCSWGFFSEFTSIILPFAGIAYAYPKVPRFLFLQNFRL